MNNAELSSALRSVIATIHRGLRKQMGSVNQYSMTEIETIGLLMRHEKLLPSELAVFTRIKTQSMSQILKKLEEQDIVKRTPSKDDKRKVFISLTALGKKMVEKTRYDKDEWLKSAIEELLTEKEKEILIKSLPVLNKIIESKKIQ
jgi:DNA-binding MarR family transcriptional regulator